MATYDSSDSEADDVGGLMTVVSDVISSNMEEILETLENKLENEKKNLEQHLEKTVEKSVNNMKKDVTNTIEQSIDTKLKNVTDEVKRSLTGSLFFKGTLQSMSEERGIEDSVLDGPQTSNPNPNSNPIDEQEESDAGRAEQSHRVVTPKRGRPKFHWKGHRQGEEFIKAFLEDTDFSRALPNKKECYKAGLEKGFWTKGPEWQLRVFHKVDSVAKAKAHTLKDN